MPLYEHRKGGRAIERVRTVWNSLEDNRLGLIVRAGGKLDDRPGESWHLVDETTPAAEKPKGDTAGG